MANLHIDENTEIGNTGIKLSQLINRLETLETINRSITLGYNGSQSVKYKSGQMIPFMYKAHDTINGHYGHVVPYKNGIIDLYDFPSGTKFRIICTVWSQVSLIDARPWIQLQNYDANEYIAGAISDSNSWYHSIIIDSIVPFRPVSDGIMRLCVKQYLMNNAVSNIDAGQGDGNTSTYITIQVLE